MRHRFPPNPGSSGARPRSGAAGGGAARSPGRGAARSAAPPPHPSLGLAFAALAALVLWPLLAGGRAPASPAVGAAGPAAASLPAPGPLPPGPTLDLSQPVNLLLLGVDARPGDPGRSDTAIVLHIDAAHRRAALLSIPRDSRVEIPGHGVDKFNAAYAYGGAELARRTAQRLLGIPVPYCAVLTFQGFAALVDAAGGVRLDVPVAMDYDDPDDTPPLHIHLRPGPQVLDGAAALQFVRFRHDAAGDDIGRVGRQQAFLQAAAAQVLSWRQFGRLPRLWAALRRGVTSNLPASGLLRLAPVLYGVRGGITAATLPGEGRYVDGVSYWLVDRTAAKLLAAWR